MTGQDPPYFQIVQFLDITLTKNFDKYSFEVLSKDDMGDAHGLTYPDKGRILIREDVYKQAYLGKERDRMTLAHELGHLILHPGLGLARMSPKANIKPYASSEWQANAFAGELLVSADHIEGWESEYEIAEKFGVSFEAAKIQRDVFIKDGIIKPKRTAIRSGF